MVFWEIIMKTITKISFSLGAAVCLLLPGTASARDGYHGGGHYWGHGGFHGHGGVFFGVGFYPGWYGCPYPDPYWYPYPYYPPPYPEVYRGRVAADPDESMDARVQQALADKGYYSGRIDGVIGPASRDAIRGYQHDKGLAVTGRINDSLVRSLDLD